MAGGTGSSMADRDSSAPRQVDLGQVVAQHHVGLAAQRQAQRVGGHVRVAVAVAADPLAHAQKGRHRPAVQRLFDLRYRRGISGRKVLW
jgi:hypothetical protein